jgi:hypothetical protein
VVSLLHRLLINTTQTTTPAPSYLQQAAGLGGLGLGVAGAFGGFKAKGGLVSRMSGGQIDQNSGLGSIVVKRQAGATVGDLKNIPLNELRRMRDKARMAGDENVALLEEEIKIRFSQEGKDTRKLAIAFSNLPKNIKEIEKDQRTLTLEAAGLDVEEAKFMAEQETKDLETKASLYKILTKDRLDAKDKATILGKEAEVIQLTMESQNRDFLYRMMTHQYASDAVKAAARAKYDKIITKDKTSIDPNSGKLTGKPNSSKVTIVPRGQNG